MLGRRAHATQELEQALARKGYTPDDIADTCQRLAEHDLLDDAAYARGRARYRAEVSRWGRQRILRELKAKGVTEDDALAALDALTDETPETPVPHDFQETATALLQRKFKPVTMALPEGDTAARQAARKELEKEKMRRVNFLLRRGFSHKEAQQALHNVMDIANDAASDSV